MRIEQLTFTRFIAAIAIVIFHYGIGVFPFNLKVVQQIFAQANIGVSYFFILSGFVMIIAYHEKSNIDFLSFMKNRIARIYPMYLFAIILIVLFNLIYSNTISYRQLLLNILTIQAWFPKDVFSINYTGWTISVEFFFYLSFPFLFNVFYKKLSIKKLYLPVFLVWIISLIVLLLVVYSNLKLKYPNEAYSFFNCFPLLHLNEFLIGNLTGLFFVKYLKNKVFDFDVLIVVNVLLIMLLMRFFSFNLIFHNGLLAILFIPLIILLAMNKSGITKIFNSKICVLLGEVSFNIYILQGPIFIFSRKIFNSLEIKNETLFFYSSFLALILISILSHFYIEKPLRNYIQKFNS